MMPKMSLTWIIIAIKDSTTSSSSSPCLLVLDSFADKLPFIHELDSHVKDINVMMGAIMANRSKYGLEALAVASSSSTTADQVVGHKEKQPPLIDEGRPNWRSHQTLHILRI